MDESEPQKTVSEGESEIKPEVSQPYANDGCHSEKVASDPAGGGCADSDGTDESQKHQG